MEPSHKLTKSLVVVAGIVFLVLLVGSAECRSINLDAVNYGAVSCRKHAAVLTQFGAVGDGVTSNTKAFQSAIAHLSGFASDGGAELIVPPGKWLTGSFNLTSHFTLFLHKDAVILASEDESEWPILPPLPSYGVGRDAPGGRFSALIFGTNLRDVVITGNNGTIDGQGKIWWDKFRQNKTSLLTRPYLIELLFSDLVQISNLTLLNSPSWNVHPTYSSNVLVQGLTIIAPVDSPNTDGINPDSSTNVLVEDNYIVSGDDCIAVKSGWDNYGIAFGKPTQQLIVRRLTCISPDSAAIALGSEMSGGIQDVRIEDITAINTQSAVRIKTGVGRGGFVRDIHVRRLTLNTMKYVFRMTGNYGQHPGGEFDPRALPEIKGINYKDIVASDVAQAARLEGIENDPFTGICVSNVTIGLAAAAAEEEEEKKGKAPWECSHVEGVWGHVTPPPCDELVSPAKGVVDCPFPENRLPIEDVQLKTCSSYSFIF